MVKTIVKDCYQTLKAVLKIMLACYHLTISKMTMTGSVGHVSDQPIFFLYVVKKELLITKKLGTIQASKNLLNFSKITE